MIVTPAKENYYYRPEVSNSDLSWLEEYWQPKAVVLDLQRAYAFGSLIDAMITEPHKVDYFKYRVQWVDFQFTKEDFENAKRMKGAFLADPFCRMVIDSCSFQKTTIREDFAIEYEGVKFTMPARCKWDFFHETVDLSGDIKSTVATTQAQCENLVSYFNYDRSRAWYMDLEGRSNDMLVFISKVNFKVFKIPVKRGGAIYNRGKAKYQELAWRWMYLFGNLDRCQFPYQQPVNRSI